MTWYPYRYHMSTAANYVLAIHLCQLYFLTFGSGFKGKKFESGSGYGKSIRIFGPDPQQ